MYIQEIHIHNLRVFADASAKFQYPGRVLEEGERKLEHPNINLILGNNGAGKSSLLKAIALACLGPLAQTFQTFMIVRQSSNKKVARKPLISGLAPSDESAKIEARILPLKQDFVTGWHPGADYSFSFSIRIERRGSEEIVDLSENRWHTDSPTSAPLWAPIYEKKSSAFFATGYGATRRVDSDPNAATPAQKTKRSTTRHQRIESIFTEGYTLVSLGYWLPALRSRNPDRFKQVSVLINSLLPRGIEFTTKTDETGEYLFAQNGALVPFAGLSDGCRAFIGWVADMLYHLCFGCPSGVKLVDNCGIVLVDEIDLHLHPEWQKTVLPKLAKTFPNLQFIVTTHSPIVVGTLQRENIWVCEPAPDGDGSVLVQKDNGVHGLTSDQLLNTDYFGFQRLRARRKEARLKKLAAAATRKVPGKALEFLKSLSTAWEDEAPDAKPTTAGKSAKRKAVAKKK